MTSFHDRCKIEVAKCIADGEQLVALHYDANGCALWIWGKVVAGRCIPKSTILQVGAEDTPVMAAAIRSAYFEIDCIEDTPYLATMPEAMHRQADGEKILRQIKDLPE